MNLIRKSYYFNKYLLKLTNRLYNLNKKPYLLKKEKKKKNNCLFILMRPNNTFLTAFGEIKLHNITGGTSGFKGPKRSSPYSRHVVARNMSYYLYRKKLIRPLDLYFNSMITRKFFFFFKGLIVKRLRVRFIIKNKMVAHGFVRPKKKRRK